MVSQCLSNIQGQTLAYIINVTLCLSSKAYCKRVLCQHTLTIHSPDNNRYVEVLTAMWLTTYKSIKYETKLTKTIINYWVLYPGCFPCHKSFVNCDRRLTFQGILKQIQTNYKYLTQNLPKIGTKLCVTDV